MFSPKDDVTWYAERYKQMKKVLKHTPSMQHIQLLNKTMLITSTFTVLFNERQKKGSYHGLR